MTPEAMPEPDGPDDERFVYVVTAAGVEALRGSAAAFDSEQEADGREPAMAFDSERATRRAAGPEATPSRTQD